MKIVMRLINKDIYQKIGLSDVKQLRHVLWSAMLM